MACVWMAMAMKMRPGKYSNVVWIIDEVVVMSRRLSESNREEREAGLLQITPETATRVFISVRWVILSRSVRGLYHKRAVPTLMANKT